MAARLRPRHQDEIRAKIQTSQLINRLMDHIHGNVELSSTQVKAIEILMKKSLPDLSAVEHSGTIEATGNAKLRLEDVIKRLKEINLHDVGQMDDAGSALH